MWGPDYSVVRISLVALTSSASGDLDRLGMLQRLLQRSGSAEARKWADYSFRRAKERLSANTLQRKYVNVVGGRSGCSDIAQVCAELQMAGFSSAMAIVPGPLVRATEGEERGYSHMPLQPGSTYEILHDSLDEAYRLATRDSPDPEIDLRGLESPLWGHHSSRRGGDTVARQSMAITGVSEADIDIVFGWQEAFYSRQMQRHYESHFDRARRSAVTSMW